MPRRSAAELAVLTTGSSEPTRLRPPTSLSEPERNLFRGIVTACDARHFRASDTPLLCRYVEAAVLAERAAQELRKGPVIDGRASPWLVVQEKAVRAMTALSLRLRLSPQSRIDPKTVGRANPLPNPRPWEPKRRQDDEEDADATGGWIE